MDEQAKYLYKGYVILQAPHPTALNPTRRAWDIMDGEKVRKANISTVETAKHVIDTMLKYGYWGVKTGKEV